MENQTYLNHQEPLEKGKLYHFNGEKLVVIQPLPGKKLTITNEAMEAVKKVRNGIGDLMEIRPELSVCASAMLLASLEVSDIHERISELGSSVYKSAKRSK